MKNLQYYLDLDYDVVISRREADGDIVYKAYARELDQLEIYGVGDTKEEALRSFYETKDGIIPLYIKEGRELPEPIREKEMVPSGKFLLRTGARLHHQLTQYANAEGKSLNFFVCEVLNAHMARADLLQGLRRFVTDSCWRRPNVVRIDTEFESPSLDEYKGTTWPTRKVA